MELYQLFRALGDQTRLEIVQLLLQHSYCGRALARKLGMAVEYMSFEQGSPGKYKARFETICTDPAEMTPEEIMSKYYSLLARDIKAQPSNYLWSHKRWKNLYDYKTN